MKHKLILLLVVLLNTAVFAQGRPKIAVYVTGGRAEINRALNGRVMDALVNSGRYSTIERSDAFLDQVAREMAAQRSGAIDDSQISALGRQAGANFVCVVEILEVFAGGHQMAARIINVETVEVTASGLADGPLKNMEDFAALSNAAVSRMLGQGTTATTAQAALDMVFVRGGTFRMGCTDEQGDQCDSDEKPVRSVTVSDFYIGKYPVTQKQWVQVMGSKQSYYNGDNLPVESVSWHDVQEFIRKLNSMTGRRYRLPTEAEWEYAARGGASSRGYRFSGSNNLGDVGWYSDNSGSKTHPVGSKASNELGIHDMSGNVWEWVGDWYGAYGSSNQTNPQGPPSGSYRVIRGGSWYYDARYCRVSFRYYYTPDYRFNSIGFRLVLSP